MQKNKSKKKQHKSRKQKSKKAENIIFVYDVVPAEKTLFPKKLKRAQKLLRNAKLLP
jgi:hypothetical protein